MPSNHQLRLQVWYFQLLNIPSHYIAYEIFILLIALSLHQFPPILNLLAVKTPDWRNEMAGEINTLEHNSTWTLTSSYLQAENLLVANYKSKYRWDVTIERCKTRFVAKGFSHTEGLDYHANFHSGCQTCHCALLSCCCYHQQLAFVSTQHLDSLTLRVLWEQIFLWPQLSSKHLAIGLEILFSSPWCRFHTVKSWLFFIL